MPENPSTFDNVFYSVIFVLTLLFDFTLNPYRDGHFWTDNLKMRSTERNHRDVRNAHLKVILYVFLFGKVDEKVSLQSLKCSRMFE